MENEVGKSVDNQMDKYIVTIMGKSESQMDIVEKSTRSGQKSWSLIALSLSVLLVLMTCAVVALVILYSSSRDLQNGAAQGNICTTHGCVTAAARIIQNMDPTAEPCENFYQYACGGWLNRHVIPETSSRYSIFDTLRDELEIILKGVLETPKQEDRDAFLKAKVLYRSCMNESFIEQFDSLPLLEVLHVIGGWPVSSEDWNITNGRVEVKGDGAFLPEQGAISVSWTRPEGGLWRLLKMHFESLQPAQVWAQFNVLVITCKALNSLGPGYLKERLLPYVPAHTLRSGADALLQEPSLKEIRRVTTRRRAFSVVAPQLWNSLPREVRLAPSLYSFWHQAKIFLFSQCFKMRCLPRVSDMGLAQTGLEIMGFNPGALLHTEPFLLGCGLSPKAMQRLSSKQSF
ncbi:Membrane metallo-endopeptidase-like 1 [Varanus komodoensis]|nr:Membrane metallo-endopeptidase-like 1 [Varanus komodoensis]